MRTRSGTVPALLDQWAKNGPAPVCPVEVARAEGGVPEFLCSEAGCSTCTPVRAALLVPRWVRSGPVAFALLTLRPEESFTGWSWRRIHDVVAPRIRFLEELLRDHYRYGLDLICSVVEAADHRQGSGVHVHMVFTRLLKQAALNKLAQEAGFGLGRVWPVESTAYHAIRYHLKVPMIVDRFEGPARESIRAFHLELNGSHLASISGDQAALGSGRLSRAELQSAREALAWAHRQDPRQVLPSAVRSLVEQEGRGLDQAATHETGRVDR